MSICQKFIFSVRESLHKAELEQSLEFLTNHLWRESFSTVDVIFLPFLLCDVLQSAALAIVEMSVFLSVCHNLVMCQNEETCQLCCHVHIVALS